MDPNFVRFIEGAVALVITVVALNALLTCARELKAIRAHLDRLTPEALPALKTARRSLEPGT